MIRLIIGVGGVLLFGLGCSVSSTSTEQQEKPRLDWVVVDDSWGIQTACGGDGIRLYINRNNSGGLAAVVDHSCDK